jgi:hypothetical protein
MSAASSTVSAPAAAAHPGSVLNADTVAAGSSTPGQVCRKTLVDFFEKWELSDYVPDFKKGGYVFVDGPVTTSRQQMTTTMQTGRP